MKNLSIRTRILAGVVLVNLLGAIVLMLFLHQSYSSGLLAAADDAAIQGRAAWEQFSPPDGFHPVAEPARALSVLARMKAVTGADYGLLVDKDAVDEAAYAAAREAIGEQSVWDEDDSYGLLVTTSAEAAERMQFDPAPSDIPKQGRGVGLDVGSCWHACHGTGSDEDYWSVRASNDETSSGHAVFAVYSGGIDPIGIIYVIEDVSTRADEAERTLLQTIIAVSITLIVATLTIGALMDILILRRLKRMTTHIQDISMRVAGGDFDAQFEPDGSNDEIGSFEKFFADFIGLVSMTLKQLSRRE